MNLDSVLFYFSHCLTNLRQSLGRCIQCNGNLQHINNKDVALPKQTILNSQQLICLYCWEDLPSFNLADLGGDLLHWPAIDSIIKQRQFDHLICISPYQVPFTQWINQFKYQGSFELQHLLSSLLIAQYQQLLNQHILTAPDCIMAVPMHVNKWQQRGFNQSTLLAKNVAKQLDISFHHSAILRNQPTKQQVGMTGNERRKNLKNAFNINLKNQAVPEHVLLVDDVVTTGSTANEISCELKKAGVNKVSVLAICLSLPC